MKRTKRSKCSNCPRVRAAVRRAGVRAYMLGLLAGTVVEPLLLQAARRSGKRGSVLKHEMERAARGGGA